jgi:nucleotide-binding universal stress UspA family protein
MERIVVGVDGSPGSAAALAWALKLADETGARLEAVRAWELSYSWIDGYLPDVERWTKEAKRAAEECLDGAVAAAIDDRPHSVEIVRTLVEGHAAGALLDRSTDADLLVVGDRGRGGFAGLLLGSVSQQCVHHARVPVVIVPHRN